MSANLLLTEKFDLFYNSYVECALWTEEIEGLTPNDEFHALNDCMKFLIKAYHLMDDSLLVQHGHDFWLTRNGHGSGFWDRNYLQHIGDALTKIAHEFGTYNLKNN